MLLGSPAFAGNVTLVNTATSGIWHFSIECFTAPGRSSGVTLGKLAAGKSIEKGNAACESFTIKFKTANSDKDETYTLVAGKRYRYYWNVDHWDLAAG